MPTDLLISVRFEGRGLGIPRYPQKSMSLDVSGTDHCTVTQDIPTTAAGTPVNFPASMSTLGPAYVQNLADPATQPTQYVDFGRQVGGTFYQVFRVYPGESFPLRLSTATNALYAKANAATTKISVTAVEE